MHAPLPTSSSLIWSPTIMWWRLLIMKIVMTSISTVLPRKFTHPQYFQKTQQSVLFPCHERPSSTPIQIMQLIHEGIASQHFTLWRNVCGSIGGLKHQQNKYPDLNERSRRPEGRISSCLTRFSKRSKIKPKTTTILVKQSPENSNLGSRTRVRRQ